MVASVVEVATQAEDYTATTITDRRLRATSVLFFHADRPTPFDDWREEFDREANRTYAILWGGYGKLSEKILQDCLGAEVHGDVWTFLGSAIKPEQVRVCKKCGTEFNDPRAFGPGGRKYCSQDCHRLFFQEKKRLQYQCDADFRARHARHTRAYYARQKLKQITP